MIRIASSLFITMLLALCLHVASAHAQYVHTCVSAASGSDANTCHCTQPCRTFQRAHAQTLSDGQITVRDPGDYGPVTITKGISIVNDDAGTATIIVSGGGTGVEISAGGAAYVNLRGLTIQGVGFGGSTGIRFDNGYTLTITNCVVRNHTGSGIEFRPNASSNLAVSNTVVADNGQSGIFVQPIIGGVPIVKAELNRVEAYNNSVNGFTLDGSLSGNSPQVTISDSVAGANAGAGFKAIGNLALVVVRSSAVNNGTGVALAGNGPFVSISASTVTGNTTTWSKTPGNNLSSYGDNVVDFNSDGSPAFPGAIAKQ